MNRNATQKIDVQADVEPWTSGIESASGRQLSDMSTHEPAGSDNNQATTVRHTGAFAPTPITITAGPPKERPALLADDSSGFRFLDLPAELRNFVYTLLFEHESQGHPIKLCTFKRKGLKRRTVRTGFEGRTYAHHKGLDFDSAIGKWVGLEASAFAVSRVCKQIAAETMPLIYGDNNFWLGNLFELRVFLDGIGPNCKHLRHISIRSFKGYYPSKGQAIFSKLSEATDLRSLSISHTSICRLRNGKGGKTTLDAFAEDVTPLLQNHRLLTAGKERGTGVLDLIKVTGANRCPPCRSFRGCYNLHDKDACNFRCCERDKGVAEHLADVSARLRKKLAKKLGVSG